MADEPETDARKAVMVRMASSLLSRIDSCARASGIRRGEAIRQASMAWCAREEAVQARRQRLERNAQKLENEP